MVAELNAKVISDVAEQPRLIYEAVAGSRAFAAKKEIFAAILNSEHSLKRLLNLLGLNLWEAESPTTIKTQLAALEDLHTTISDSLSYLANCFEAMEQPQAMVNLDEALSRITQVVQELPTIESPQQLIAEHSFLFFMEQILKELENMRKLISKVNDPK